MPDQTPLFEHFDHRQFRDALGRFATGICVVSTRAGDGRTAAITVNSFSSVSLEPPLVLFCIGNSTGMYAWFSVGDRFVVNVLSEEQQPFSNRFANSDLQEIGAGEFDGHIDDIPAIAGALATLGCQVEQRITAGDHDIVLGRVEQLAVSEAEGPLVYYRGGYHSLGER